MPFAPARHEEDPRFAGVLARWDVRVSLETVSEHRDLDAGTEAAIQHRSEGLEGRIEATAATVGAQGSEDASEHHSDAQAGAEAAAAENALLSTKAAEAAGATAELAGEAAEAGDAAAEAVTVLETLLEAGLIGILCSEAAACLLQSGLVASLVRVLLARDAAAVLEALLEAGLKRVLAGEAAHAHHLLHLGQLLLHLSQLLLHHARRATELAGEALARKSAGLLHGEVVELLSLLTAALLLLSEKFAE